MSASSRGARALGAAVVVMALGAASCSPVSPAGRPPTTGAGQPARGPYLGWSTWSLQALQDGRTVVEKQSAAFVEQQSDVMAAELADAGYRYINVDSFWWSTYDEYGRQEPDPIRFPDGIAGLADHVHANGQKFGIYAVVGMPKEVYDADSRIEGTSCTARDITRHPPTPTNGWGDHWALDWSNPCSQAWINSRVAEFAAWGVDFVKLDGVEPSYSDDVSLTAASGDNRADVAAWKRAIDASGRPMWFTLSWDLSPRFADSWAASADAVRTNGDVECYCATLTNWVGIRARALQAPVWTDITDRTGLLPDFDSLDVADGERDGLTDVERRTAATLWAISGSPWYLGDDLTRIDDLGRELITDPDVLDLVRSGRRLRPISTTLFTPLVETVLFRRQVWARNDSDGSTTLAVINASDDPQVVSVPLVVTGLSGSVRARDLWSDADLGSFDGALVRTVPAHGSILVRLRSD